MYIKGTKNIQSIWKCCAFKILPVWFARLVNSDNQINVGFTNTQHRFLELSKQIKMYMICVYRIPMSLFKIKIELKNIIFQ